MGTATDEGVLIPLLARRSYHLPGNTWWDDWLQWLKNNHILFGICLHHPLHPLETWERCLYLTASISFGLVATGTIYYLQTYHAQFMEQEIVVAPTIPNYLHITYGMLALWTLGGAFHSIFDMVVWHVMACACCHPGGRYGHTALSHRCKDAGSWMLVPIIAFLLGLAGYFVLLRASNDNNDMVTQDPVDDYDDGDDGEWRYYDDDVAAAAALQNVDLDNIQGADDFAFLIKYAIELVLAWFVYFPVLGTVLFSGILGCNGWLPILGGRPRDVNLVAEEAENRGATYRKM